MFLNIVGNAICKDMTKLSVNIDQKARDNGARIGDWKRGGGKERRCNY